MIVSHVAIHMANLEADAQLMSKRNPLEGFHLRIGLIMVHLIEIGSYHSIVDNMGVSKASNNAVFHPL